MRRPRDRDPRLIPLLLVLIQQLRQQGILDGRGGKLPLATLLMAGVCIANFFYSDIVDDVTSSFGIPEITSINRNCILPYAIIYREQYRRLLTAAFVHVDYSHIYYNMASLIYKGITIEGKLGTVPFAALCLFLTTGCHTLMCLGAWLARTYLNSNEEMQTRTVGISGLLFAMKLIINLDYTDEGDSEYIQGFVIPSRYVAWAELILIYLAVPNSSFAAHFCGILIGLVYVVIKRAVQGHKLMDPRAPLGRIASDVFALLGLSTKPSRTHASDDYDEEYETSYRSRQTDWGSGRVGGDGPRYRR